MPQKKYSINGDCYIPLSKKIQKRVDCNDSPFFSVEFFPPKTKAALENLITRFDNFRQLEPLFADITWHAAANSNPDVDPMSITVADLGLNYCSLNMMLHLTCVGMTRDRLLSLLERAKAIGIRNILALRGDKATNSVVTDFHYASDLITFIREHYDDYFTIAVAGYPTKHPESASKADDLRYLKHKVDAGADFIITQLFFEFKVFDEFVRDCREAGIKIPIIPGIMPIQNYDSLERIARLSQLTLPEKMISDLEPIKNNDEAVRNYGIEWTIDLCRAILKAQITPGLHFYTLNRQHATITIVKALKLVGTASPKQLPWTVPANHRRSSENVRPIFWSSRPKSYVHRTNTWDEFPNGRWGKLESPAFGELSNYYLFEPKKSKDKLRKLWGEELKSESDVWQVFHCYLSQKENSQGYIVDSIPWNDEELRDETSVIIDKLSKLNLNGILTINSQPNINGIQSSDPIFGWGEHGGYIYQKVCWSICCFEIRIWFCFSVGLSGIFHLWTSSCKAVGDIEEISPGQLSDDQPEGLVFQFCQ